jgi:hypothetical protein
MENVNVFTVYMYAKEYEYLTWLVLQFQATETGGDLFGVWQDERTAVVQFVLGPGKECRRTTTSFFQDVTYLDNVGRDFTTNEGICNIGEWHSHHRIGLAYPSSGDQNTVWGNMGEVGGGRFLVFIANIQYVNSVKVGCFMFNNATGKMTEGKIKQLPNCSPMRHKFEGKTRFQLEAEPGQDWETFCKSKSRKASYFWRRRKVRDFEYGEKLCACEIEESVGCCTCFKRAVSCVCWFFRAIFSVTCRCTIWALRSCFSGIVYLLGKCGNTRLARD